MCYVKMHPPWMPEPKPTPYVIPWYWDLPIIRYWTTITTDRTNAFAEKQPDAMRPEAV